jgi:hypothetical protein
MINRNQLILNFVLISTNLYLLLLNTNKTTPTNALNVQMNPPEKAISNLSHVIVPFHFKQLDNLKKNLETYWSVNTPCRDVQKVYAKPKIVFFVGYLKKIDLPQLKTDLKPLVKYLDCFPNGNQLDVITYEFNKSNDQHVLGARLMFEHVLSKNHTLLKEARFVFYMEPDTRPIRSNWLAALENEIGLGSSFWMKGSIFRGKQNFKDSYVPNKYHINGNAIYNLGDDRLAQFYFKTLRPFIEKHGDSLNAYDTDFFEYLMDLANHAHVRHIAHKFHFSDFIQNLWQQEYSVQEMRANNPETYLIHGGFHIS